MFVQKCVFIVFTFHNASGKNDPLRFILSVLGKSVSSSVCMQNKVMHVKTIFFAQTSNNKKRDVNKAALISVIFFFPFRINYIISHYTVLEFV